MDAPQEMGAGGDADRACGESARRGGKLIGTPVFDRNDEFAKQIESKWENGFLRMASAGLEPIETSADPALQLCGQEGKVLKLAAGEDSPGLPLLQEREKTEPAPEKEPGEGEETDNTKIKSTKMTKEQLALLGLAETATEEQATAALALMKQRADNAEQIQLAAVTQAVDQAVAERRILAEQREHFIKLGKSAGVEMLSETLATMHPQKKPTETINLGKQSAPGAGAAPKTYAKLSEVPEGERLELRKSNPGEYMRLYKEEYGVECPGLKE